MRTTVDIDARILKEVKALQKKGGGSLGEVVSRLLAEALAQRSARPAQRASFRWITGEMKASVDLRDKDAVYAILDAADRAAEP